MVIKSRSTANIIKASLFSALLCAAAVPAMAQDASSQEAVYNSLLEQISNKRLVVAQKEAFLTTQQAEIDSLEAQLEVVEGVSATVNPMIDKMVASIEVELNKDIPFKVGERFARLQDLQELVAKEESTPGQKMSRALNIYDIEVAYGQSFEAYDGDSPIPGAAGSRLAACREDVNSIKCDMQDEQREMMEAGSTLDDIKEFLKDGNYLRYGRIALAYLERDESVALRYDPASKEWVELTNSQALEVRRGVKSARGEAAPTVVNAPVYVNN